MTVRFPQILSLWYVTPTLSSGQNQTLLQLTQAPILHYSEEKRLLQLCLAMPLGCEEDGRFYYDRKKESNSHFYMQWAEHYENYYNSLMHTLDHRPCASLLAL